MMTIAGGEPTLAQSRGGRGPPPARSPGPPGPERAVPRFIFWDWADQPAQRPET